MPSSTSPFIDRLAALSHAPDRHFGELRAVYQDTRVAVPGTVFNAVLNRPDPVLKEDLMQAHKTVSREEWLEARRALLAKEKAHLQGAGRAAPRERRELPWVKVDKDYVFDGPNGKETLCRPVRRPQPADRQALHAGPGLAGRLRRLLVRRRPDRRLAGPPDQPRRHAGRRLARAATPRSRPSTSAWAGTSSGCRRSARDFNFDYHVSFTEEDKARGKVFYNFEERATT